jgi:hypothetical protein
MGCKAKGLGFVDIMPKARMDLMSIECAVRLTCVRQQSNLVYCNERVEDRMMIGKRASNRTERERKRKRIRTVVATTEPSTNLQKQDIEKQQNRETPILS